MPDPATLARLLMDGPEPTPPNRLPPRFGNGEPTPFPSFGPSWMDQALADQAQAHAAYQQGGVPAMMQNIDTGIDLASGFGGGGTIRAYHGSPHNFERFDFSKIGTGEGAQTYGRGLYFAGAEPTAMSYKPPSGKMYEVDINANPEHFLDWDKPLSEQHPKVQEAANNLGIESFVKKWPGEETAPTGEAIHNYLRANRGAVTAVEKMKEAGIPGIKYLDQGSRGTLIAPSVVKTADGYMVAEQGRVKPSSAGPFDTQEKAQSWVDQLQSKQTSNYVVFDDALIDILKKYGIVGALGGTGGLFTLATPNQEVRM